MKQPLGDRRFHNSEEVGMVVREWLRSRRSISSAKENLNSCQDKAYSLSVLRNRDLK